MKTNGHRAASVCVLTSVHAADDTRILLKECRSLARAGYRVTLIAARGEAPPIEGIEVRRVAGNEHRLARATATVMRVCREAIRAKADIYHFHDPELIWVGLLLAAIGKKVVFDIHEDIPRHILVKDYLPAPVRVPMSRVAEVVLRIVCRKFSGVVAATPAIADLFAGTPATTRIVQNFPLENELIAASPRSWQARDAVVAYVGGVTAIRGAREMVRAMELVPESLNARLRVAGSYSPDALRTELAHLPGWRRVEYVGVLDRRGVAEMLGAVRAGIVLFHPNACHVSAYPTKMFEYMSAGIPVIASNFPLWKSIIESAGCGLTVDPLNPSAIAAAITFILSNPADAESMGASGRDAVRTKYNWGREEEHLLELYSELVR